MFEFIYGHNIALDFLQLKKINIFSKKPNPYPNFIGVQ